MAGAYEGAGYCPVSDANSRDSKKAASSTGSAPRNYSAVTRMINCTEQLIDVLTFFVCDVDEQRALILIRPNPRCMDIKATSAQLCILLCHCDNLDERAITQVLDGLEIISCRKTPIRFIENSGSGRFAGRRIRRLDNCLGNSIPPFHLAKGFHANCIVTPEHIGTLNLEEGILVWQADNSCYLLMLRTARGRHELLPYSIPVVSHHLR
jgi:hypothetical protein